MSVLNVRKKPTDLVRTWDGTKYEMMTRREAKKLVDAGTHQLTEGLQAKDLKRPDEFKPKKPAKPASEPKDMRSARGDYDTKVMEAS